MTTLTVAEESLAKQYEGVYVRVYLNTGTILSGRLEKVIGYEALLHDSHRKKESFINLAHVVSISKL